MNPFKAIKQEISDIVNCLRAFRDIAKKDGAKTAAKCALMLTEMYLGVGDFSYEAIQRRQESTRKLRTVPIGVDQHGRYHMGERNLTDYEASMIWHSVNMDPRVRDFNSETGDICYRQTAK